MKKIIGLDVSKNWLDICIYNSGTQPIYERFSNDKIGQNKFLEFIKNQTIDLIICEPTGGYEEEICKKLSRVCRHEILAHINNPLRQRPAI